MRRARIGVQASKASSLLKERKNVSLYGEQCSYAKGRDCCPAEHRPVRYHPDFSWPNRRRSADRCAMQSGRGYRQAAVRDERCGDQGPLRLLAAAASLQIRRLGCGIPWSDDDVMGDREVMEVCPADDKDELTPLEMPSVPKPKNLRTYRVTWVIEVEADTPLSAARRARFWQTRPGTTIFEVSEVCLCPAERYGPPVTIDLTPDAD